jgi:uncharacterized RDD family membrane protein YckC
MFSILGVDGKEYGPVSVAKLNEWMADGRANLATKARRANETEWYTLGDFAEFNPVAAPAAPSVPGTPAATGFAPAPAPVAQLPLAGLGARFAAALIDGFLQLLCKVPFFFAFAELFRLALQNPQTPLQPEQVSPVIMAAYFKTLPWLIGLAAIQVTLLCVRSQSVGKLLLGLRIVSVENEQPGGPLRAFLLRAFIPTVIEFIPFLGILFWFVDSCFIFRDDHRCIHDLIAGTKVVRA